MIKSLRTLLISIAILSLSMPSFGQDVIRQRINANPKVSAGNYNLYPEPESSPLKAPSGYKAVYISTYARHGSRWLISESDYTKPQTLLHQMDQEGNLTDLGKDVMARVDKVCDAAKGRYEELTEKGVQQHRGIASRMYRNFPTIFKDGALIKTKSTTVIRCILSMNAATNALSSLNPKLKIEPDASRHDMYYMNWSNPDRVIPEVDTKKIKADFEMSHVHPERFMSAIFKDPSKADNSFYRWMFEITGNVQNSTCDVDFYDLYTAEELSELYILNNTNWYLDHGNAPASGNVKFYAQTNLLRQIIKEADASLSGSGVSADLRFGHDGILISVLCLMGLDDCNASISDLETVSDRWNITDLIPMGSNLQIIFYQNKHNDTLVSFYLNERVAKLPITEYKEGFYRWSDVKKYWEKILSESPVKADAA